MFIVYKLQYNHIHSIYIVEGFQDVKENFMKNETTDLEALLASKADVQVIFNYLLFLFHIKRALNCSKLANLMTA